MTHRLLGACACSLVRRSAGDLWLAYSGSINADVLLKCIWSGTSPCIYHGCTYTPMLGNENKIKRYVMTLTVFQDR